MNGLADQQRALQRAIALRRDAGPLLRALPDREPLLRIYQNAYTARLVGALRDNYGVLPQVMGDEAFDALALAYVAEHPSRHASIRWFGDKLPQFMGDRASLVPHPALIDLARMEWALRSAFDAANGNTLDPASLASMAADQWPRLTFEVLPSVQLLAMEWAVEPVWRAMQSVDVESGEEPELPEPVEHAHALLIWRQGLENRWRSIDSMPADLLRAAMLGSNFAELCELAALQVGNEQAAATAVGALQSWLADGLLAHIS